MRAAAFLNETRIDRDKMRPLLTSGVMKLDRAMRKAGHEVRIVGGAVRDMVLGKEPKDIDMATDATPDEMTKIFKSAGISYVPTGLQHGTITAVLDKEPIEITTLRIDRETDGRHANVEFTRDWKVDAERRDLTFNAMSLSLDGELHDYFGGVRDLRNGVARFVGNAVNRVEEDYLRILRYFRFQGRMDNPTFDQETIHTIKRMADGLENISGERIWMEMEKILSGNHLIDILEQMKATGVLKIIGLPLNLSRITKFPSKNAVVNLTSLLPNVEALDTIRKRWKFDTATYKMASFILNHRDEAFDATVAQVLLSRGINKDWIVRLAEATGHGEVIPQLSSPAKFPVTGQDLINVGMKPGPDMGKVLGMLRSKWEQSGFKMDKESLLGLL